jgi:hypothetical protein
MKIFLEKFRDAIHGIVEGFDRPRFRGKCYRAANWIYLGQKKGAANLGLQGFRAFLSRIFGFTRWQVISGKNSLDLGWGEGSRIFTPRIACQAASNSRAKRSCEACLRSVFDDWDWLGCGHLI